MTKMEELEARQELKALVDNYATESDKNNQDYYVNVFTPDCHVQVYFGETLGMDLHNVQDVIREYKGFEAAKESFHMNGRPLADCGKRAAFCVLRYPSDWKIMNAGRLADKNVK